MRRLQKLPILSKKEKEERIALLLSTAGTGNEDAIVQ